MRITNIARMALLCGTSLSSVAALAQSQPRMRGDRNRGRPVAAEEDTEIVVTGTQIQGAQINDVLPVTVVDEQDIENTGASSGDELFRSIPRPAPSLSTSRTRPPRTTRAAISGRSTCAISAPATRCC